jgi:hypothetical protein
LGKIAASTIEGRRVRLHMSRQPQRNKSARQALQDSFDATVLGIMPDLPLLMHGCGADDVPADACKLIATLTVQYMGQLVDAALESYEAACPGLLPPPPPPPDALPYGGGGSSRRRQPSIPPPVHDKTRKKRASEELWDEPLPEPKIKKISEPPKVRREEIGVAVADGDDDDNDSDIGDGNELVDPDEWVGAAGVDVWEQRRPHNVYVRGIAASHFVFPVCHDRYVYGRIRELQTAKLSVIDPVLAESTVRDIVVEEAKAQHMKEVGERHRRQKSEAGAAGRSKRKTAKKDTNKEGGNTSDPDDEDETGMSDDSNDNGESEEEEAGPTWPGLEDLLPAYRHFG